MLCNLKKKKKKKIINHCECPRHMHQNAAKSSNSNYIEASTVQMYKIDGLKVVGQLYLPSLSVFTYV